MFMLKDLIHRTRSCRRFYQDHRIDASTLAVPGVPAIGKPKGNIVIEPIEQDGGVGYRRDNTGVHNVPKRYLKDVIFKTL